MPKINIRHLVFYGLLYWPLTNLYWVAFMLKVDHTWDLMLFLEILFGFGVLYHIFQNIFLSLYFICLTCLLLYWWIRKASIFKALILIALGPYLELEALSNFFIALYNSIWLIGFTTAAYAVRWANTGKWTPIMEK